MIMAWDKNRPFAPFWKRTDWRAEDYGSMCFYDDNELYWFSEKAIDQIWDGEQPTYEAYDGSVMAIDNYEYRPFKDVPLLLTLSHFEQRRAAGIFWWEDNDGHKYPMFAAEFNRLIEAGYGVTIDGVWSAEKRGANYGIRLVRWI